MGSSPRRAALRTSCPQPDKRFLAAKKAFRFGCDKFGMRLIEFSVQSNHMHLIVEANHRGALSKGMQGLMIRLAKQINPEVRNAVHYVGFNGNQHTGRSLEHLDVYSSAWPGAIQWDEQTKVIVTPTTWLLQHANAPPSGGRL